MNLTSQIYEDMNLIFGAALSSADPIELMKKSVFVDGDLLKIKTDSYQRTVNLADFSNIFVIGAGKATAKMALALEFILGDKITKGIIAVKYCHTEPLKTVKTIEAGHPVPDEKSVLAASEIISICDEAVKDTLVINLISGGGSALLCSPKIWCDDQKETLKLSLKDKQIVTQLLLNCGATIQEINSIRKHFSNIKGGQLAKIIYPAISLNFILSDVVGDNLDYVASGLTFFDQSSYGDVINIINKYDLFNKLPSMVKLLINFGVAGKILDTPTKEYVIFENVHNILIGSNYNSLLAAADTAKELGYNTSILSSKITGEACKCAKNYADAGKDILRYDKFLKKPACVIGGGETTVTIKGKGKGGRNQEMALSFLAELDHDFDGLENIYFLSAATDGNDGPTDAAGAYASKEILDFAKNSKLDCHKYLADNDSYNYFNEINCLLKTGPTNTNVCDVQIMIIV